MFGLGKKKEKDNTPKQSLVTKETEAQEAQEVQEVPEEQKAKIREKASLAQKAASAMPLGPREMKYLRKANYSKRAKEFPKAFVVQHKRKGMIAEINAFSSFQACNFLGWKANQVKLIQEKDLSDNKRNKTDVNKAEETPVVKEESNVAE